MKRVLPAIGIVIVMFGCSSTVPIKVDISTAEELPKDVALNYLQQVGNEKPKTGFFNEGAGCIFSITGVNTKSRINNHEKSIDFDEVVASANGSSGFLHGSSNFAFLYLYTKDSMREVCPIIADGFDMRDENNLIKINKIMTAVKSLGVKVEGNK